MTAGEPPTVLVFDGAKTDGGYLVRDGNGTPIARIKRGWTGSSFIVTAADGAPLSSTRRGGLFTKWTSTDASGRPLAEFKPSGKGGTARLPDGRTARIKGRWLVDDWSLVDSSGRAAVSSTTTKASWIFGARPWAIQIIDPTFTTVEVIALVESHRLALKARSAEGAAAVG